MKTRKEPKSEGVRRADITSEKVVETELGWRNRYYITEELPDYSYAPQETEERVGGPKKGGKAWWSGVLPPPAIGARTFVRMNGFGDGVVRAYFVEYGWLGVEVELDNRPDWHREQNGDEHPWVMVFGVELEEAK